MLTNHRDPAKSLDFTIAFEQMCSAFAIADADSSGDAIAKLSQQCLLIHGSKEFRTVSDFVASLKSDFGLDLAEPSVRDAISRLEADGRLEVIQGTYSLPHAERERMSSDLRDAISLEDRVRTTWLSQLEIGLSLDPDFAWSGLRQFLVKVFRRHGVQSVQLLDPAFALDEVHEESLGALMDAVVRTNGDLNLGSAIKKFLDPESMDDDRTSYIAQLADTAFHYFSIHLPPEVSEEFRERFAGFILFFDTNVLFGVLDIDVERKQTSLQLIRAIQESNLNVRLRYHEATLVELTQTIQSQARDLVGTRWTKASSGALSNSRTISGVALRYHQKNLESPLTVKDFLQPLEHPDAQLKALGLEIYRPAQRDEDLYKDVLFEYQAFISDIEREQQQRGLGEAKERSPSAIDHDAQVLAMAHQLRLQEADSLQAACLIVSLDGKLARFDRQLSRDRRLHPRTVTPEALLQVLRPFLRSNRDYDQAFAKAFAIPEFRTISAQAREAAHRIASMLSSYSSMPQEVAARIISNRMFLESIKQGTSDEQLEELLERQIQETVQLVVEEAQTLRYELGSTKEHLGKVEAEITAKAAEAANKDRIIADLRDTKRQLASNNKEMRTELDGTSAKLNEATNSLAYIEGKLEASEARADAQMEESEAVKKQVQALTDEINDFRDEQVKRDKRNKFIGRIAVGGILVLAGVLGFSPIRNALSFHRNAVSLWAAYWIIVCCLVVFAVLPGQAKKQSGTAVFIALGVGVIVAVVTLLGGVGDFSDVP